jgi:hypothetical protein
LDTDRPPRFAITLRWAGKQRRQFSFGNDIPFSQPAYSENERIVLLPSNRGYERQTTDSWVVEDNGDGLHPKHVAVQRELPPGSTVSQPWDIWANPEKANVAYIEAGIHRVNFSISISVSDGETVETASEPDESFEEVTGSLSIHIE